MEAFLSPYPKLQVGTALLIIMALLLIGYGLLITPNALGANSLIPVIAILMVYFFSSRFGTRALQISGSNALTPGILFGFIIGAIFLVQIASEYLFPVTGQIDQTWGYIAFGGLPLWYLLASLIGAYLTRSLRAGVLAAMFSAIISSLIWINVLYLLYFFFLHTPQELQVLAADNTLADFKRSGIHDLSTFVMQDYLGGSFFHLLLSPLVAAFIGILGAILGKGLRRLQISYCI